MGIKMIRLIFSCILFLNCDAVFYDTYTGKTVSLWKSEEMQKTGLIPWCVKDVQPCNENERRRVDGTCNNLKYPPRGGVMTPYARLMPPNFGANYGPRPSTSGEPLPNARALRVAMMSDGRSSSQIYTQLVPHVAVFLVGDFTALQDTVNYIVINRHCCQPGAEADPRCTPIRVPENDLHLRRSNVKCFNLTRPITYQDMGCLPRTLPPERINLVPILVDLSDLYGASEQNLRRYRTEGGRFRADILDGKEWPPNGGTLCINNELPLETRCHDTPSTSSNSVIGANLVYIWLFRNHNMLARQLQNLNPCWDDDRIFFTARDINIAMWQKILFYELFTAVIGHDYLVERNVIYDTDDHINDYNKYLEPRVYLEFDHSFRWFHTMLEGRIRLYDKVGRIIDEKSLVDLTLRTGILANNGTLAGMTQGAFRQPSANNDHLVDPDVGERIFGRLQFAADVISSDIKKGREFGLQPYNQYRMMCGMKKAHDFDDLLDTMDKELVDALKLHYETVDDMDTYVAMVSERPLPGGAMGPTAACVISEQMYRWRTSDRFWFENNQHPFALSSEQLFEVRRMSLARLLCDNGDDVEEIQPNAFFMPIYGNQMVSCREIPKLNYQAWYDPSCNVLNANNIK